jgi:hypothetical protein
MKTTSQSRAVAKLVGQVNHFKDTGLTFCIGDEIRPSWQDVTTVLRHLWLGGYVERYNLVQTNLDLSLLFSGGSKETYSGLIVQIVMRSEYLVQTGTLDVFDHDNYRLIVGVYVLSWWWFHNMGGPKPKVSGLREIQVRKIIQNEPLQCPVCNKKYTPNVRFVTQAAKMWAFVQWLPSHCVEYHFYTPPKHLTSWITKDAMKALVTFKAKAKSEKGGE